MKIREKLEAIRRLAPKGPTQYGQIYATKDELQRSYDRITFWTVFRSDENTHMVRPHVFIAKKSPRTPAQWYQWLAANLDTIQRNSVLPGLNDRTGMQYFVLKKLGWIGHARKFANTSAVGRKWRPTKQKGK